MSECMLFNTPNPVWKSRVPEGALYWEGEEFVEKTGGWGSSGWNFTYFNKVDAIKNIDNMYLEGPGNTSTITFVGTLNSVDLTNYSNLKIECTPSSDANNCLAQINKSKTFNSFDSETILSGTGRQIFTIPVSSISGEKWISFTTGYFHERKITIYKVWLE